jgi:hypothetical protein
MTAVPLRRTRQVLGATSLVLLAVVGPGQVAVTGAASFGSISGRVTDANGNGVSGLRVVVQATGQSAATVANGTYVLDDVRVTPGPYDVQLLAPCNRDQTKRVVVDGDETVNVTVAPVAVQAGYRCQPSSAAYVEPTNPAIFLAGEDDKSQVLGGLFPTRFPGGRSNINISISSNGFIRSAATTNDPSRPGNSPLPSDDEDIIAPFWDDLVLDGGAAVGFDTGGTAPNRYQVFEWRNARLFGTSGTRITFEAVIYESGRIVFNYKSMGDGALERGASATVGIAAVGAGAPAVQRSFNQPLLDQGFNIEFIPSK